MSDVDPSPFEISGDANERAGILDSNSAVNEREQLSQETHVRLEIDCDDTFCGRLKLLFTPYHKIPHEGRKSFSIVFLPETYYLYALLYFWLFFGVCMLVTTVFSDDYHEHKDDNPVTLRDGYNMICVSWDYPPVTKFSVPFFLPFLVLLLVYAVLDLLRVWHTYNADAFITKPWMIAYEAAVITEVFCVLIMPETMAVQPGPGSVNFWLHTIPYLLLLLALWLLNATQVFYYEKVGLFHQYKRKSQKWYNCLLTFYLIVITVCCVYKFVWSTVNLIGMTIPGAEALWLNHRFPQIKEYGRFIEYTFLITVAILPLPIKILIAPQLKDKFVLLSMTHDVALATKKQY